ncbi:MAG: cytidylate kinase-like family protein [candidate division KSB1 bacterium]|nr:cytidylate kinase-like family protein [candidate division KSB1 bacterium]
MAKISTEIPVERLITKQVQLWAVRERLRELGREPLKDPWSSGYVAISRNVGSRAGQVAQIVADALGWQVFGREIVEKIACQANLRQSVVESFDEKRQSEIQTWIQTIIDRRALGPDRYLRHLLQVLLTIAQHGQAVIIGRGAYLVLPPERGIRVWITAPLEKRIEVLRREHGISREEARRMIETSDAERKEWLRRMFRADACDPTCFDLIVNTGYFEPPQAAELILRALEERFGCPRPSFGGTK